MMGMIRAGGLVAVSCLALAVRAEVLDQSRYGLIIDRNPFNLQDPPPPPPPAAPPEEPVVKLDLQLAGISVGPDGPVAWLVVPPKPGQNTNTLYWKLKEWSEENPDEQGDVKVLSIDVAQRTVKVQNAGAVAVLDLSTDAPPPSGPAVVTGSPTAGRRLPGRPGVRPGAPGAANPAGRNVTPTVRQVNSPGNPAQSMVTPTGAQRVGSTALRGANTAAGYNARGAMTGGGVSRTVPARQVRTTTPAPVGQDPAVQWLMMRAQEEAAAAQGIPMPPTPTLPGME